MRRVLHQEYMLHNDGLKVLGLALQLVQRRSTTRGKRRSVKRMRKVEVEEVTCQL